MGDASTTILEDMIRQALKENGVSITDSQQIPADFDFQKVSIVFTVSIDFKLKVFKKTLEEIIRKLEEHDDYQSFPEESLSTIKRGLDDTRKGLYAILESKIHKDIQTRINEVLPFLRHAESFALEATTLLKDKGKGHEYYDAILSCYDEMFQIKLLLRTW
jgi:hypothetical protein